MNARTNDQRQQPQQVAIATQLTQARLPITAELAKNFGVTEGQWRVLIDQVFPGARSIEAVSMALNYCRERKLDIFKKPVHIVPMYSSALKRMVETVWPGISEIRTTAARTGEYAGIDEAVYGPPITKEFVRQGTDERGNPFEIKKEITYPEWCKVTVHRIVKGEPRAFHAKVFWREAYATEARGSDVPNEMWARRSYGQIEKVAEAAALRKAFPEEIGNEHAAEEMAGRIIDHDAGDQTAVAPQRANITPPKPPAPPSSSQAPSEPSEDIVDAEVVEETTGEVTDAAAQQGDENADYFQRLEAKMAEAKTVEEIVEVWLEFDAMAKFEGDEESQALAMSIKRKHTERVAKAAKKATRQ